MTQVTSESTSLIFIDDPMDIDDIYISKPKQVRFSETVEIKYTYSREVYDRSIIDSAMVLKSRRQLNDFEWRRIFIELNQFKIYEMRIHPDSKKNTSLSKIPSLQIKRLFFNKYLVNNK